MMENLEKYITDNLDQFNCGQMPAGHNERFLARLSQAQATANIAQTQATAQPQAKEPAKRRIPHLFSSKAIFAATSAAAAIIIALVATTTLKSQDEKYTIGIQELAQEMFRQEAETLLLFEEDDQYMINNVKAITNEAIPLSEQLPSELTPAQRAEILREYYKAKTAALKTIKTLYAQSGQTIE